MSVELKPVAWRYMDVEENFRVTEYPSFAKSYGFDVVPLYAIPDGYALVPIEPTREMREAFHDSYEDYENGDASCPDAQWKAMIAAAQEGSK